MVEVFLNEIGRKPKSFSQKMDLESYSLTAGLALGNVLLGKGDSQGEVAGLDIAERLRLYITGPMAGLATGGSTSTSTRGGVGGHAWSRQITSKDGHPVRDADAVTSLVLQYDAFNVENTAPAAMLALGLIFIRSGSERAASILNPPQTRYELRFWRPHILLISTYCRGIILWDDIRPSLEWVYAMLSPVMVPPQEESVDTFFQRSELVQAAFAVVVAGACFTIGLRYAGTADSAAFAVVSSFLHSFLNSRARQLKSTPRHIGVVGFPSLSLCNSHVIESCLQTVALSASLIMAGTGNLELFRTLRLLSKRVGNDFNYGTHMATGAAIGLLFLGNGQYSLSNSNEAIAALVCSLYPVWPEGANDNQYHLQAFRHLYALATQNRCLVTLDSESDDPCYMPIKIHLKRTSTHSATVIHDIAPCLLPPLEVIECVELNSPRYWSQSLARGSYWVDVGVTRRRPVIYVKRKAGYLAYMDDPTGCRSILFRPFPKKNLFDDKDSQEMSKAEFFHSFASDPQLVAFAQYFCSDTPEGGQGDRERESFDGGVLYECVTRDLPEIIPIYLRLHVLATDVANSFGSLHLSSFRLAMEFSNPQGAVMSAIRDHKEKRAPLLQWKFFQLLKMQIERYMLENTEQISGGERWQQKALAQYRRERDLPGDLSDRQFHVFACILSYYA